VNDLTFRTACESDVSLILSFIKALAEYEKMADEVVATEELMKEWIFEKKKAEVFFAVKDGREIGFALFFHNFSTFLGRAGIYIEDLYVLPEYRRRGYGKEILTETARIAVERGCGRLEWACLDWNEPSINFYLSLGAQKMDQWTVYRLAGDALKGLAENETRGRARGARDFREEHVAAQRKVRQHADHRSVSY
jgi:GNAT superfamily N-acetyltransferase